jgi:hypothetical protein
MNHLRPASPSDSSDSLPRYTPSSGVYCAHLLNFRYAYNELRGVKIGGESHVSTEEKKQDALAWVRDGGRGPFSLWATCAVLGFDYRRVRTRLLVLFDSPPASPDLLS